MGGKPAAHPTSQVAVRMVTFRFDHPHHPAKELMLTPDFRSVFRRPRLRRGVVLGVLLALLLPALNSHADPRNSMQERLRQIADRASPRTNRFLNTRRAEQLSSEYKKITDPLERFRTFHRSADELVKSGNSEKGIRRIRSLLDALLAAEHPPYEVERELRYSLAIAYLRLGEQENCVLHHGIDSCLFPIRGNGVHVSPEGSRNALEQLEWLLTRDPDNFALRWLINLAAMTIGEHPDAVPEAWRIDLARFDSAVEIERFIDVSSPAGLDTIGLAGGACMDDFDGDGRLDIVASSWGLTDQVRFFHNRGDGTFEDRTVAAGLTGIVSGLNTIHADVDGDGDLDLLILRGAWLGVGGHHPNSLLRNDGKGHFTDVTAQAGLLTEHPTQTAAFADFDRDGDLDLFVGNESARTELHPCELFENQGDGTFREIAKSVGLAHLGYVKGATWGDFDNDGRPDLYLSTMASANALYRNLGPDPETGQWQFVDVTEKAGVGEPNLSFATWFWDYDNDGHLDLLACSYGSFEESMLEVVARDYLGLPHTDECFRLYRNRGDGTFIDATEEAGLKRAVMAMGANFGDIDGDGYLDAYFGTGQPDLGTLIPNRMFRNDGGKRFQEVTTAGGFGHLQKGHGIAFGDLDQDGDQDIFAVMGGAYEGDTYANVLFQNPGNAHRFVTLRLVGTDSNADAIGARVRIVVSTEAGERSISRVVSTGGSFGSSSLQLEVGLGRATAIDRVEVNWPVGREQTFTGLELDQIYRLVEGTENAIQLTRTPFSLGAKNGEGRGGHKPGKHGEHGEPPGH